jgi:hypothetical protein
MWNRFAALAALPRSEIARWAGSSDNNIRLDQ